MILRKYIHIISVGLFFLFLPTAVFGIDTDADGLEDHLEAMYFTDPQNPDTDGDGYSDFVEIEFDYSPHTGNGARMHEFDYDGDGLNDWVERWFRTSIGESDTDGNGLSDYEEIMKGRDATGVSTTLTYERRIVVDRSMQRLYYYVDGINMLNMPVSTGNPDSETPEGSFTIERMIDEKSYIGPGYNLAGVKWNMQFKPMYYIHAAYWHNDFGKRTHSHGCVNMREADAKVLYSYVDVGVPVFIEGVTPRGYRVGT